MYDIAVTLPSALKVGPCALIKDAILKCSTYMLKILVYIHEISAMV
jgi:hypothetical protein